MTMGKASYNFRNLLFSRLVVSNSATPMACTMPGFPVLHYLPVCSKWYPLSQWCHPMISSSATPSSPCLQSFPASGSFPMSQSLNYMTSHVALVVKNPPANSGDIKRCRFDPWVQKALWRRVWQPTPMFLPGESPWTEEPGGLQSMG